VYKGFSCDSIQTPPATLCSNLTRTTNRGLRSKLLVTRGTGDHRQRMNTRSWRPGEPLLVPQSEAVSIF